MYTRTQMLFAGVCARAHAHARSHGCRKGERKTLEQISVRKDYMAFTFSNRLSNIMVFINSVYIET